MIIVIKGNHCIIKGELTEHKLAWKWRKHAHILWSAGFSWLSYEHLYKIICFGLQIWVLGAQLCWFALYQWRGKKGWKQEVQNFDSKLDVICLKGEVVPLDGHSEGLFACGRYCAIWECRLYFANSFELRVEHCKCVTNKQHQHDHDTVSAFNSLIDWLMMAYIALFSALLSRLTALACDSTWGASFLQRISVFVFNIHQCGVLKGQVQG